MRSLVALMALVTLFAVPIVSADPEAEPEVRDDGVGVDFIVLASTGHYAAGVSGSIDVYTNGETRCGGWLTVGVYSMPYTCL